MASQTKSAGVGAACGNVAQLALQPEPLAGSGPACTFEPRGWFGEGDLAELRRGLKRAKTLAEASEGYMWSMQGTQLDNDELVHLFQAIGEALREVADSSLALFQGRLDAAEASAGDEAAEEAPAAPATVAQPTDGERFEAALSGRAHAHASHLAWQQWALAVSVREIDGAVGYEERNRRGWLASMSAARARELAEAIDLLPHPDRCAAHGAASTLAWQLDALCTTVRDSGVDMDDSDRARRNTREWLAAMAAEKAHQLARAIDALPVQTTSGADAESVLEAAHA